MSPEQVQKIAAELNRRGVVSPRGSTWAVSAIYGCANKGSGVLNNELYAGRYVWNRSQWVKDPDTGKRQRIDRPKDEWSVTEAPDLRIIDQRTWDSVRRRLSGHRLLGGRGAGAPAKTLFGGLMRCPYCGGAMIAVNKSRYGCNMRSNRGSSVCKGMFVSREQTDKRLLSVIRDELLSSEALAQIEAQVHKVLSNRKASDSVAVNQGSSRVRELDQEIVRLVDAIASIGLSDSLKARLLKAEEEKRLFRSS
jgi:hypothetical protein